MDTVVRSAVLVFLALLLSACGGGGGDSPGDSQNRTPVAQNVVATTNEGEPVSGRLIGTDADGDALSFQLVTNSSAAHRGLLTITNTANGDFTYVPHDGAYGTDEFVFRVNDGKANSSDATLTIHINARPRVMDKSIATVANELVSGGVDMNDPDGGELAASVETQALNGIARILDTAEGAFEYEPNPGFVGNDEFTVVASDGAATSAPGRIVIEISPRPEIAFQESTSIGNQGQTKQILLRISPPSPLSASVNVLTEGTAIRGVDYDLPSTTIDVQAGESLISLPIVVHERADFSNGATAAFRLVSPCNRCNINTTHSVHDVILDQWRGSVHIATDSPGGAVVEAIARNVSHGLVVGGHGEGVLPGSVEPLAGGFVAKYDLTGLPVWVSSILPPGQARTEVLDLIVTPDGSVLVTGASFATGESKNTFLAKLDSVGKVQWSTVYGGSHEDVASAIAVDSTGNIYIAGYTFSDLDGLSVGSSDLFLAQFDSTGAISWVRQIGSTETDGVIGVGLATSSSDQVMVATEVRGSVDGTPILGAFAVLILAYDATGTEQWRKFLNGGSDAIVKAAAGVPSGGFVITGVFDEGVGSNGVSGPFVAKLSDIGHVNWLATYPNRGGTNFLSIAVDDDENISATGLTGGDWSGDGDAGVLDIITVRVDSLGNLIWAHQVGGTQQEWGTGVGLGSDGDVYITGWSRGDLLGFERPNGIHSVIFKLDTDGMLH